jgi:hypothetical protein
MEKPFNKSGPLVTPETNVNTVVSMLQAINVKVKQSIFILPDKE